MCIDVLCSYLRMAEQPEPSLNVTNPSADPNGTDTGTAPSEAAAPRVDHADREVRHTVLRTIATHLRPSGAAVNWREHDFDLTGITLDIDVLDLTDAEFSGGTVNFYRAPILWRHGQLPRRPVHRRHDQLQGGSRVVGTSDGASSGGSRIVLPGAKHHE